MKTSVAYAKSYFPSRFTCSKESNLIYYINKSQINIYTKLIENTTQF